MELKTYQKINIAETLLNKALEIYYKEKNYFAVLHLAGASEEISGRHLQIKGAETSFESDKKDYILACKKLCRRAVNDKKAGDVINSGRNAIKHMNGEADKDIIMDPKFDAEAMLDRAILNWWRLEKNLSDKMNTYFINQIRNDE